MSIRIERKSNTMTISSLNEWRILNKFNLDPLYQRKSVWSVEQQSLLIDSILKNIPIPPIFLRENINKKGNTSFEVIDGKQRLSSIFKFIDNDLLTTNDDNDALYESELAGLSFSDLEQNEEFESIIEDFWRYPLPIEYVYTKDDKVVDKIFDRLNRSGEKLNGQELRHSNYYDSPLINTAYKIANTSFWKKELEVTNKNRMEDIELISEMIFLVIEDSELSATPRTLDGLYAKYARSKDINWAELERKFCEVSQIFEGFNLDFSFYNVSGVSHLYGVWAFSYFCYKNDKGTMYKDKLHEFFSKYKESNFSENQALSDYKHSMSNATKDKSQRSKRKNALVSYCTT